MPIDLSEQRRKEIREALPTIDERYQLATFLAYGVVNHDTSNLSKMHISLVCLRDAFERLKTTREALNRCHVNYAWYKEESKRSEADREYWAVSEGTFYADYVMLLLYATAEDFAAFILYFMDFELQFNDWLKEDETKKKLAKKAVSSLQSQIGIFMGEKYPNHFITKSILTLHNDEYWRKAISYRNTWVHDKPPIVEGLGYEFNRKNQIEVGDGYRSFTVTVGSSTDFNVEELIEIADKATFSCVELSRQLLEILIQRRQELGETIDFENGKLGAPIV